MHVNLYWIRVQPLLRELACDCLVLARQTACRLLKNQNNKLLYGSMLRCGFFSALGLAYTNYSTTLPPVVGSVIAFTGKSHNKMVV